MKTIDICTHCIHYMQAGGVAYTCTLVCGVPSISKYILIIHLKIKCMHVLKSPIALITTGTVYKLLRFYNSCRRYVTLSQMQVQKYMFIYWYFFLDQIECCLESNEFLCFYDNNQKLNNFVHVAFEGENRCLQQAYNRSRNLKTCKIVFIFLCRDSNSQITCLCMLETVYCNEQKQKVIKLEFRIKTAQN